MGGFFYTQTDAGDSLKSSNNFTLIRSTANNWPACENINNPGWYAPPASRIEQSHKILFYSSTRLGPVTFRGRTYCTWANLFGDELNEWNVNEYMGVSWLTFKDTRHSMRGWNMKIRPHGVDLTGKEKAYVQVWLTFTASS